MKVPGQVSWLSGHHLILSLPLLRKAEQWLATSPGRTWLADHSGGTTADSHGLSFSPLSKRSTAGTKVVKEPTTQTKLAPSMERCQCSKHAGGPSKSRVSRTSR